MARTKKYLSKKTKKTSSGFYRPLKRVKKTESKKVEKPTRDIQKPNLKVEDELSQELLEVKKLKQQLEEKIALRSDTKEDNTLDESDFSIKLFDDTQDEQRLDPNDSSDDLQLPEDDPEEDIDFTTHDEAEKEEFLQKQLEQKNLAEKKAHKEIEKLKEEYEKEKKAMQRQLSILRKDMHRQEPITHNKFFSLSKELGEVVNQMDKLVNSPNFKNPQPVELEPSQVTEIIKPDRLGFSDSSVTNKIKKTEIILEESQPISADQPIQNPSSPSNFNPTQITPQTRKKRKIPKIVIIMGTTFSIVALLIGVVWFSINKRSDVSQQLLQEYLPEGSTQNAPQEDLEKKIDQFVEEAFGLEVEDSQSQDSQVKGDSTEK
jgi:hypothetical protein